ncbi:peptidoglycan editing factor PgeF [Halobacillus locisalis]|uniref:Purine nucleoside phosphorylase n=1 Tax=Halobacillus locisalis TaxID=220753 RepID=A0A838CQV6_9BACI|nr:peptidoglycan editing factor PgeF [Halobacillus locisalis]MBA2174253.1 peptidoglycan editing factor PgeF [Halobacillus locisalis]
MVEPFTHVTKRQLSCFSNYTQLIAGLTTRHGGVSAEPFDSLNMGLHVHDRESDVVQNRDRLADEIGIPLDDWVMGEQVHGVEVKYVDESDKGKGARKLETAIPGVDGLITNNRNVVLAAFYADCVPLYFVDPVSGWIGIAHAGWKGTVHGMVKAMTDRLVQEGASLDNMEMTIGPCISAKHYEVDQRVMENIPTHLQKKVSTSVDEGHFILDLKALNHQLAIEAGLQEKNVHTTRYCTYEEERLLYSHRRDQGKTGRMLGYIGWKG